MDIADFLSRTRHIRSPFPHEEAFWFTDRAETIIENFCANYSIPRSEITFHPAYTARASPELIRLNSTCYIVWDYHFTELIQSFNLATLVFQGNRMGTEGSLLAANDVVRNHFCACLFRFLSCQFFRHPHLSVVLAHAFAEMACALRTPIPRDLFNRLTELREHQWYYVLHHELAHIYFARLSPHEREQEFGKLKGSIELTKYVHEVTHRFAKQNPARSATTGHWWSRDNDAFEDLLRRHSEDMLNNFNQSSAEEIVCDYVALSSTVHECCLNAEAPIDFQHNGFVACMEWARSAANSINNFRYLLEFLRMFWLGLARKHEEPLTKGCFRAVIAQERETAAGGIQEIFLRASLGSEIGWYSIVARALGQSELRLDDPQLAAYVEKSRKEREAGQGVEGFDESFTRAWAELATFAQRFMSDELIDSLFGVVRQKTAELLPQQALKEALDLIEFTVVKPTQSGKTG
jgi:hypothetical protein